MQLWQYHRHRWTWGWGQALLWFVMGLCGAGLVWSSPGLLSTLAGWPWQAGLAVGVTVLTFLLTMLTAYPPEMIFLGGLGLLMVSGVLDTEQALEGFSNPGMVTVGVLYVVVTGLQQTGGLAWISQQVLGLPKGLPSAMTRLMLPVMGLSVFLNNTPVVAMFVPVVNDWCRKLRISPSKLMIPLSYAAIFGGTCSLIGTSTNLVVNGMLIAATDHPGLGLFDITRVSLPCAVAGVGYLLLSHRWLLPQRKSVLGDADDPRQYTVEMVVEPGSPLAGKTIEQAGLRHLPGLFLMEIARGSQILTAVTPREVLQEHDQLVFVGMVDSIVDLQRLRGLKPATDQVFKLDSPRTERSLIEAVVSNTCPLVGMTIREGQFRSRYNAVVLAVARNGERLPGKLGDITLMAGDTLLLEAHSSFLEQQRVSRDFYLVSEVPNSEPLRHDQAPLALAILIAMVVLASVGWMSMLNAAALAAILMVALRCCSAERALRSIEWQVLLVIGAALGLGKALEVTGAAGAIASTFIGIAGDNPWLALAVVYGITTLMTEIITNNAAAAVVFPIALAVSQTLGVSPMPFVIAIMIGASASFSTPIGYQTNLMVYGPGGYKFSDFMRVGIPLNLLFWSVTVLLTPLVYPF
ncbi:putative transporter [Halomicronema hongdechloris C2206]|uniref:Transporter n=1 Tax=Halomicronema hongdechloris C2206 TaxID=1641165 RepID=A0A1Z3HLJ5_9CYAN|nr:SLC13 family permease [Halomicronema hongdechloris]ASC71192.1 putative transporter [Halomicronema hongdechloris C2206]